LKESSVRLYSIRQGGITGPSAVPRGRRRGVGLIALAGRPSWLATRPSIGSMQLLEFGLAGGAIVAAILIGHAG
jgi:hypothetical protein